MKTEIDFDLKKMCASIFPQNSIMKLLSESLKYGVYIAEKFRER